MKSLLIKNYTDNNDAGVIDGIHPVLQVVYKNRNLSSIDELDNQLKNLLPYTELSGIEKAADIVATAITHSQRVLIVGDFDADGATSTAVVIRLLKAFGVEHVSYLVPNRFDFGYGLTKELLEHGLSEKPDLIITVDNGIASIDGVGYANQLGIKVVVTDHHLAADELPKAAAIVNPNQPGCNFTSKSLAGVGVVFYLMMAVRALLRERNWFTDILPEPNLASVLDLVALGTVADVVPLDRNNRILVDQGLKRIRSGQCCPGIKSILQIAGRNQSNCVASDLGFSVAPRLNAAGRLEDMSVGIECLISDDEAYCLQIAERLHQLNLDRRSIESDMLEQALSELESVSQNLNESEMPSALILYNEAWHQGVIGILASRIKERYNRPVIAFALSDNNEIKGSARSIKGFHIRDALDLIDKAFPNTIIKFGGHAMAAGLTIKESNLELFKKQFEKIAGELLSEDDLQGVVHTDGELKTSDFSLNLAETLRYAGPWGQHFPEPVFDNVFIVNEWRVVGTGHLKLKLQLSDETVLIDAIAFNTTEEQLGENSDKIRALYKLDVNEFRNKKSLQLMIEYLEPA